MFLECCTKKEYNVDTLYTQIMEKGTCIVFLWTDFAGIPSTTPVEWSTMRSRICRFIVRPATNVSSEQF